MSVEIVITLSLGALLGASLVFLGMSLRTRPVPLGDVLGTLNGPAGLSVLKQPEAPVLREQVGEIAAKLIGTRHDTANDLEVVGRSREEHAISKVVVPAFVLLGAYGIWLLLLLAGVPVSALWVAFAALLISAIGFIVPDARLRSEAETRRLEFRHALSAYLDLVTVIIAGGGGIMTGLQDAADAGAGWPFEKFRHALDYARLSGRAPWDEFQTLAQTFDIDELAELASAADLAGGEGAKISESIATKASVLRARLASEIESVAEARTEKMVVPLMGFATALFLFLGFAVAQALLADPNTGDGPPTAVSVDQFTFSEPG